MASLSFLQSVAALRHGVAPPVVATVNSFRWSCSEKTAASSLIRQLPCRLQGCSFSTSNVRETRELDRDGLSKCSSSYPLNDVEYKGSFATAHKRLKQASLLNTIISCAASPVVLMYAELGTIGRVGLAVTLTGFGLATTGALHWFTKPYVHRLSYTGSTGEVEVQKINLFALPRVEKFHISDVTFPTSINPAVTFMVGDQAYYIEKNIFPDEELLYHLTPEDPSVVDAQKQEEED